MSPTPDYAAAFSPRPAIVSIHALAENVNRWCEEHGIQPVNGQSAAQLNDRNIRYYRVRGLLDAPGSGAPAGAARRGFTEKHVAQLRAIRLLQSRGLPLDRIQEAIAGLSLEELRAFERRELGKPPLAVTNSGNGAAPSRRAGGSLLASLGAPSPAAPTNGENGGSGPTSRTSASGYDHGDYRGYETPLPAAETSATAPPSAAAVAAGQENWLVTAVGEEFLLVARRGQQISDEQRRLIAALLRA